MGREAILQANELGRSALAAEKYDEAEAHFKTALRALDGQVGKTNPILVLSSLRGLLDAISAQGRDVDLARMLASYDPLLQSSLVVLQSSMFPADPQATERLNSQCLVDVGATLRDFGKKASSMEELSQFCARSLHERLVVSDGVKATSLVRVFHTVPYSSLPPDMQAIAQEQSSLKVSDDTRCLVLLGTAGKLDAWNDRRLSVNHRVIPLLSPEMVANSPMIARLFTELGVNISSLFNAKAQHNKIFLDQGKQDFNVFYVPEASTSPHIVDSAFVINNQIRTVIGYGSVLPSGELLAVIAFFHVFVAKEVAERFSSLALSTTIAHLSLPTRQMFA